MALPIDVAAVSVRSAVAGGVAIAIPRMSYARKMCGFIVVMGGF